MKELGFRGLRVYPETSGTLALEHPQRSLGVSLFGLRV